MMNTTNASDFRCDPGIILPIWQPQDSLTITDRIGRGVVYFAALCYFFLGVSMLCDKFVEAIEVITSVERKIKYRNARGEIEIKKVKIWNQTVSNLSLLALGEAAPEILLAVIEIVGNKFEAEDLGPGTIIGSAAYNLFIVVGLCVFIIPAGETRRIKRMCVFWTTILWSIFAYVWLYIVLAVVSEGVVETWEAVLTFAFFFILLLTSWIADTEFIQGKLRAFKVKRLYKVTNTDKIKIVELPKAHTDLTTADKFNDSPEADTDTVVFTSSYGNAVAQFSRSANPASSYFDSRTNSTDRLVPKDIRSNDITLATCDAKRESIQTLHHFPHRSLGQTILAYYKEEFQEAISVVEGEEKPKWYDYALHVVSFPWKLMFILLPPKNFCGGWVNFIVSIALIGILTAFIGDFASHFGCTVGLKDGVTATVFLAIGTNIPETFASKIVAINEKHADSSIVNVAGSNAVNVFLGFGLSWMIAAIYHEIHGTVFIVEPGHLGFSLLLYTMGALLVVVILLLRRVGPIKAELGGPQWSKLGTMLAFFAIWLAYIVLSSLEQYDVIDVFG